MASRLFSPYLFHLRGPLLVGGACVSTSLLLAPFIRQRHTLLLDSSPSPVSPKDWSFSQYQTDARVPVVTKSGSFNRKAIRQISGGSIIGLVAGLGLSLFSKSLTILFGLLIVGVQTAESYGIHLVPYKTMQRYVKSVDLRSAVQDNIAFKISFGAMFALSAFAELPS